MKRFQRRKRFLHFLTGAMQSFDLFPNLFRFFEFRFCGETGHFGNPRLLDGIIESLNEGRGSVDVRQVSTAIDIVVTRFGAGVHLEVHAVRMRVVPSNIEQAWPQLERPFDGSLHSSKLPARQEGSEVIDARFDLATGIDSRKTLLPV